MSKTSSKVRIVLGQSSSAQHTRVWVESFSPRNKPTDEEWAFGACLFSPHADNRGADIYREMLQVARGDLILHHDTRARAIVAVSSSADTAETSLICPEDTAWAGRPCYRIPLTGFRQLDPPLADSDFLESRHQAALTAIAEQAAQNAVISGAKQLFYCRRNRSNRDEPKLKQGAYLTEAPTLLLDHMSAVYKSLHGKLLLDDSKDRTQPTPVEFVRLVRRTEQGGVRLDISLSGDGRAKLDRNPRVGRPAAFTGRIDPKLVAAASEALVRLCLDEACATDGDAEAHDAEPATVEWCSGGVVRRISGGGGYDSVGLWASSLLIDALSQSTEWTEE